MKKYVIYLLLMMFSSMGAQAQKSYFKEALEKLVSNKAFTMNQSGAKNEVGDTAQWSWKKYRFKTLKKDKFLKELDRINKAFQKDCNQPVTDFYYMVDGNNNPVETWMNFDISVGTHHQRPQQRVQQPAVREARQEVQLLLHLQLRPQQRGRHPG